MKRRITSSQQRITAEQQARLDYKQAALDVILARIKNTNTFGDLAELVGYSHEWVRTRLVQNPTALYKIGNRYQVPKGVAEEFVRSVFV